jgi:DNA-binding XRE family transcriptional regulator
VNATVGQAPRFGYCRIDGCNDPAETEESGLCAGHRKRKNRGQTVSGPLRAKPRSRWAAVVEAAIDLADADSADDQGYERAEKRLAYAAEQWAGGEGAPASPTVEPVLTPALALTPASEPIAKGAVTMGNGGLRALRETAGLRQIELALKAGISPATLALAERHGIASPRTVAALARALKVEEGRLGLALPTQEEQRQSRRSDPRERPSAPRLSRGSA